MYCVLAFTPGNWFSAPTPAAISTTRLQIANSWMDFTVHLASDEYSCASIENLIFIVLSMAMHARMQSVAGGGLALI